MAIFNKLLGGKPIVGRVENVSVAYLNKKIRVRARMDTGAFRSSIDIDVLEQLGFPQINELRQLLGKQYATREAAREAALEHTEKFKGFPEMLSFTTVAAATAGSIEIRPVVTITTYFGSQKKRVNFTVANRSHMSKPVLIGRQDLAGYLVDASQELLLS